MDQLPEDDVELWVEELALDPWVRGLTWDEPSAPEVLEKFFAIVVGAGMGGLNAAAQLMHAGLDITVLEKNSGVGGTWYENRYPGARVDSPSRAYTHILGAGFDCPAPWRTREENQRYFDWVADEYGIREHIVFDTEVATMSGTRTRRPGRLSPTDGEDHDADVIVYATGFRANECLWPMEVLGRGGRSVHELWSKDGPRACLGAMVPGFPNLFMIYGPNMNPYGGLGVVNHQEMVTRWLLACIRELIVTGKSSVDVTERAYWRYNDELGARETYKIYKDPRASSYYRNEHGRSAVNCPFPGNEMWHKLRRPNFADLIVR